MYYQIQNDPQKNGSAIVVVLGVLVVLTVVIGSLLTLSTNHFYQSQHKLNAEQAFYLAEAGVEAGAVYFMENANYLPDQHTGSATNDLGKTTYCIKKTDFGECSISATGIVNGVSRMVKLTGVRNATYAKYAFYAEDNKTIYFKNGEEFYGEIYTGTAPCFTGDPIFNDEFSSKASDYVGNTNGVTFKHGLSLNEERENVKTVDFSGMKEFASTADNGLILTGPTTIEFKEGEILITNKEKGWIEEKRTLDSLDLLYVKKNPSTQQEGDLQLVGGELDGQLTLVAERDIYIDGNLKYHTPDLTDEEFMESAEKGDIKTKSKLGLISGDDVVITTSAPDNIQIHATIMATGALNTEYYNEGSFYVDNAGSGSPRGAIHLVGGVIQGERGVVGYFDKDEGNTLHGFDKHYIFDHRFETKPPPYYPPIKTELTYDSWTNQDKPQKEESQS